MGHVLYTKCGPHLRCMWLTDDTLLFSNGDNDVNANIEVHFPCRSAAVILQWPTAQSTFPQLRPEPPQESRAPSTLILTYCRTKTILWLATVQMCSVWTRLLWLDFWTLKNIIFHIFVYISVKFSFLTKFKLIKNSLLMYVLAVSCLLSSN